MVVCIHRVSISFQIHYMYRVPPLVASRDCEDQPTLVHLGLLRAHDHSDLANRCSHRMSKPDFGLKCLFKPYIGPGPYLGGSGPRGSSGAYDGCHLVYGTV